VKKRLYRVKLEVHICVLAASQFDAMDVALETLRSDPKVQPEGVAILTEDVARLPKAWRDRRPGGAEPNDPRTCKDHLRDGKGG
jgi:hypothetical protein